ncbi:MAG: hypothetical protein JWN89_120 [Parcubacteria group bacterium]|nr:hypothetical protein [Parcubacteria group bacterium]
MPEPGFYYHYKHDLQGSVNNYAYEVLGVGMYTETAEGEAPIYYVIYRPLYIEARVYKLGKLFDVRPLDMFMGMVDKGGFKCPRFQRIFDVVIRDLEEIRDQIYPRS